MSKQTETMTAIANKIADLMETNGTNWVKPWVSGAALSSLPINAVSNKNYRGINLLLLSGRSTPVWATYKQWADKGAQVLKGSKGTGIVFWQPVKREAANGKDDRAAPDTQGLTQSVPLVSIKSAILLAIAVIVSVCLLIIIPLDLCLVRLLALLCGCLWRHVPLQILENQKSSCNAF